MKFQFAIQVNPVSKSHQFSKFLIEFESSSVNHITHRALPPRDHSRVCACACSGTGGGRGGGVDRAPGSPIDESELGLRENGRDNTLGLILAISYPVNWTLAQWSFFLHH